MGGFTLTPYAGIPLDPLVAERQRQGALAKQSRIAREATLALDGTPTLATQEFDARASMPPLPPGAWADRDMDPSTPLPPAPPAPTAPAPPAGPTSRIAAELEAEAPPVRPLDQGTNAFLSGRADSHFDDEMPPQWGGDVRFADGTMGTSAAQQAQDAGAHADIENRAQKSRLAIDAAAVDPMQQAIDAAKKDIEFQGLQPAGSVSSIQAEYGEGPLQGSEIGSDATGFRRMGPPTMAQAYQAEQARQAQMKPGDELEFARAEAANTETRKILQFRARLQQAVQAGQMTAEESDARFKQAQQEAAFRLNALQGHSMAAWGPQKDDLFGGIQPAAPPAG